MSDEIIVVPKLAVRVVTGNTCHAYENGFSAIYAEVTAEDSSVAERLAQAQQDGRAVTLRCAMLDVSGKITKRRDHGDMKTFVLSIEDMAYRKPHGPWDLTNRCS